MSPAGDPRARAAAGAADGAGAGDGSDAGAGADAGARAAAGSRWRYAFSDRVRFGDLDAMRHLNNVAFLQFFESARIGFITELLPDHDPAHPESDFGLIFAECHIAYRSPAFYEEEVVTRIRPAQLQRSSFRALFRMESGRDGRLLAEGWGALVGYDYATSTATPLPGRLTAALRAEGATEEDA